MGDLAPFSGDRMLSSEANIYLQDFGGLEELESDVVIPSSYLADEDEDEPTESCSGTAFSYLSRSRAFTLPERSTSSSFFENNQQMRQDLLLLTASSQSGILSQCEPEQSLPTNSYLLQKLEEVISMYNALTAGTDDPSMKILTDSIIVNVASKGFCCIMKSVDDEEKLIRLRLESNQHPTHIFISGTDAEFPVPEDCPKSFDAAEWKSSTFPNHPYVNMTIDCRKYGNWKWLLITIFNISELIAQVNIFKHTNNSQRQKRADRAHVSVKQNLKLKISNIKSNHQQWAAFLARVKSIRSHRSQGHRLNKQRNLNWSFFAAGKLILKLLYAARFIQVIAAGNGRMHRALSFNPGGTPSEGKDPSFRSMGKHSLAENDCNSASIDSIDRINQSEINTSQDPGMKEIRIRPQKLSIKCNPQFDSHAEHNNKNHPCALNASSVKLENFIPKSGLKPMPRLSQVSHMTDQAKNSPCIVNRLSRCDMLNIFPGLKCLQMGSSGQDIAKFREAIRQDRLRFLRSLWSEPVYSESAHQRRLNEARRHRDQQKAFLLLCSQREFTRFHSRHKEFSFTREIRK